MSIFEHFNTKNGWYEFYLLIESLENWLVFNAKEAFFNCVDKTREVVGGIDTVMKAVNKG